MNQAVRVAVVESSQTAAARRMAVMVATAQGFDETEAGHVAIAATEAATNLLKHGGGGELLVHPLEQQGRKGLELFALDHGPGMTNFAACLRDGYSTAGSAGTGLGAIDRLSASLDVYSLPGCGTTLVAEFWAKGIPSTPTVMDVAGISVAVPGEESCGDDWAVWHTAVGSAILVVDGLGHGPAAAAAARAAVDAFQAGKSFAPGTMLAAIHEALRGTRGAAAAVAVIDVSARLLTFCGIGNIAGTLLNGAATHRTVSLNGTLGHNVRSFREFTYAWSPETLLVLHSDGINTRWNLSPYPGLSQRSGSLIAAMLYRDCRRQRDDVTAVIARQRAAG